MIAIVAGTGSLPQQACLKLLQNKSNFFVISLFPEDNLENIKATVQNKVDVYSQKFYKPSSIMELLKKNNTTKILFIGKVDKRNLLKKIKLDFLAIKILAKIAYKNDKDIMEYLVDYLKSHGLEVISQDTVLDSLFVKPGILTGKLDTTTHKDIFFGMQKANQLSLCDIGQTLVIKNQMIIAVEAIEGTNECIKRAISLANDNLIVCKSAHSKHNTKYDLPTLGTHTLKNLKPGQIKAIAWKANKTFISNKEDFIRKAQELNITLISIGDIHENKENIQNTLNK